MKKLLYIVASSKPESLSSCQRGARIFLNCFLEQHPEYVIEEINVFHDAIPQPNDHHFLSRATLVNGDRFRQLSEQDQNIVNWMQQLCD
ncbi:flavodoxin, partial [Turicibacter sanguinis]|nr:flavodoxin [Turicibacter sanguinis]